MHQESTSSYRVLIVDDNEAIHHDFRTLLEPRRAHDELDDLAAEILGPESGSESGPARSPSRLPELAFDSVYQGRAAFERVKDARSSGQEYAIAFVDMRMPPGWDGVETIQHLWEIDPNLQVIICTAFSDYTWEQIVDAVGLSDKLLLLRKPFDPNALKQMTLAAASRWRHDRALHADIDDLRERLERAQRELDALRQHHRACSARAE